MRERVDGSALRIPFLRERLGDRARGHGKRIARRGPGRAPIEGDMIEPVLVQDFGPLVEAFRQRVAHRLLGGGDRIRSRWPAAPKRARKSSVVMAGDLSCRRGGVSHRSGPRHDARALAPGAPSRHGRRVDRAAQHIGRAGAEFGQGIELDGAPASAGRGSEHGIAVERRMDARRAPARHERQAPSACTGPWSARHRSR